MVISGQKSLSLTLLSQLIATSIVVIG